MAFTPEQLRRARASLLFKQARAKMQRGLAYNLDALLDVDRLTDQEVIDVMARLDNHPLIRIDSEYPKCWSLR
jgi:hypothetical protein